MAGLAQDADDFRVISPVVSKEGKLPRWCTDDGQGAKRNISPPIEWYNLPEGTKSLALIVQDIDAPDPSSPLVPWTIWVVANIPSILNSLPEGFSGKEGNKLGGGFDEKVMEGNNDEKVPGWRVPKMPQPGHRIEFRLYALDDEVNLGKTVTKERLLDAIEGHVISEAAFIAVDRAGNRGVRVGYGPGYVGSAHGRSRVMSGQYVHRVGYGSGRVIIISGH